MTDNKTYLVHGSPPGSYHLRECMCTCICICICAMMHHMYTGEAACGEQE